ncbi:hypothetical protein HN51_017498 [Arachis hypogaea]|uniref:Uncharacterized protein n=1 Tax=Arachis hypogaea TaxID=3818 RepID=A0A445CXJ1_ARAHY|nr:uncharacterized protein LOC107605580 isoform X1 [Arachis ipaensis]XP_025660186.1 uncharacterized protein LOC112756013 [Arachis hypogaea]QHN88627.1 uncharacterized protein DS421_16g565090 [Arachis hypogaea]RYR55625.1 hypothetical protein Ahy_A06g030810 [Arachis hypogaea]
MSSQPYSSRKVLFSWEKKPSISKVTTTTPPPLNNNHGDEIPIKENEIFTKLLPPPPSCTQQQLQVEKEDTNIIPSNISTIVAGNNNHHHHHDFQDIPLPPCAFQPPYYRTSSKKGLWVGQDHQDDPFLAAYKECTKNDNNHHQRSGDGGERKKKKKDKKLVNKGSGLMIESRLRKGLSFFSCKKFSSVHDNNNLVRISSFPNNNNNIIDRD